MAIKNAITTACMVIALIAGPGVAGAAVIVNISGVEPALEQVLRSSLALARQANLRQITAASVRALYMRSLLEIGNVLQGHGYYEYRIDDSLNRRGDDWVAEFNITPGPPVLIKNISLRLEGEGAADPDLERSVRDFPLGPGMPFNHEQYESGKRQLETVWLRKGYFDARFTTHRVNIDTATRSALIDLNLETGRRYRFGTVRFPETVVDRDILDRFVPFDEDAYYDAGMLIRFGQNLRNSNYFTEAGVSAPVQDASDYRVPVHVNLTPRARSNLRVGAGYGTDSGPRLVASWDYHYFNRRGHRIDSDLRLSQTSSEIAGTYAIPDFRANGAELDLISSLSTLETDTSNSDALRFGVRQNHIRHGWNETFSLIYQYESFKLAGISDDSRLLTPEIRYWRTSADSTLNTTAGYRLHAGLKGALEGALSNMSFLQLTLNGKYIRPAGEHSRWIARGELGASYVSSFAELPASLRYFAGGDNSLRGFGFQQLGPKNESGEVIGGRYLAVGSVEYERDLRGQWSLALFTDFGNAFNRFSDHFVYSLGAGVRWRTPVGQLRIDIGAGVSEDDIPWRLHVNLGPDL